GTVRLIPKTFALITVHKHSAASTSASPLINAQHSLEGGVPITRWTSPPRRSTQAPSFNVSFGHLGGGAGAGIGTGGGVVVAGGQGAVVAEEDVVRKRRRLVMRIRGRSLIAIAVRRRTM
ncbi:hypothetical protein LINPERPRIM_LOCUS19722, partial [Linum perenne]